MPCYGCLWNCTQPHQRGEAYPCVAAVEIDAVLSAASELLSDTKVNKIRRPREGGDSEQQLDCLPGFPLTRE
jgi:hypothetical protein